MNTLTVATLDEALDIVAKASFYEDKCIEPVTGGYEVSDTTTHATDEWYWSYDGGVKDRDSVSETSRLHESYESYSTSGHIRYNMNESVAVLEAGTHAVEFAYAIVNDEDIINEGEVSDPIVGWMLVANHYPID